MHHNQRFRFQWQCLMVVLMIAIASPILLPQSSFAGSQVFATSASWGDIFGFLRRRRRDHGGRGNSFCLLTPYFGKETPSEKQRPTVLWHDRPLFVWRGLNRTIGLRKLGSQDIFWRESAQSTDGMHQLQYTGQVLQRGTTYELLFFSSSTAKNPVRVFPFTVMANPQHQKIATELQALTTRLKQTGANATAIAQQQAQYFMSQQLEADVWQTLYSIPNLSPPLKQELANTATQACQKPNEK